MPFVVTAGEVQAVQRPAGAYGGLAAVPSYVQLAPSLSLTYEALWRAQPAVRTVVGFLSRNVAQLGIDPYERLAPTDRKKLTGHPLARLLERPMPGSKWTKYRLLNHIMHELCVYDSAYLLKVRGDGGVLGILPVPARMVTPLGGTWFAPAQYRLQGNLGFRDIDADEVVHIHGYNPEDPRQGVSPIETLRQILAEEHAATVYRAQMWRNGARIGGIIKRPKDAPRWSPGARENFRRDWQAQYAGDAMTAGTTPVLEDGMEFVTAGVTPRDAQYIESRKLTREEVAVAYHVPPSMIGLMDGTNFSSIQEVHRMLYQDCLAPYLQWVAQDIECQLLEDIDPSAAGGRIYVEFNLSEKLRGSFEQQAAALQSAVGGPWMTRDEARAMFNLPHVDGADELIVPLNVVTGGLASPRDTAPDNPSNEASNGQLPKAVVAGSLARQRKAVMSHLDRADASEAYDGLRWQVELAEDLRAAGVSEPLAAAVELVEDVRDTLAHAWAAEDRKAAVRQAFAQLEESAA